MSIIKRTLVLTGCRAGQTVLLGKMYQFTDGRLVLNGSSTNVEALTHWLGVNYAAFPEGASELEEANGERNLPAHEEPDAVGPVLGGDFIDGEGTTASETADSDGSDGADEGPPDGRVPEGDRHGHSRVERIQEALTRLDWGNPAHWTTTGLPVMSVVEELLGDKLTRAELNAVAPDFKREG